MEKSRFDIISDLFKLSNVISESLKLAESLASKSSCSGETDCKGYLPAHQIQPETPAFFFLGGIREYVTEHEDKELTRKFVGLHDDTKKASRHLFQICGLAQGGFPYRGWLT